MHYICSACSSPNLLAYFSCFSLSLALLSTSDCDLGRSLGSLPLPLSLYRWEGTNTNLEVTDNIFRTFREKLNFQKYSLFTFSFEQETEPVYNFTIFMGLTLLIYMFSSYSNCRFYTHKNSGFKLRSVPLTKEFYTSLLRCFWKRVSGSPSTVAITRPELVRRGAPPPGLPNGPGGLLLLGSILCFRASTLPLAVSWEGTPGRESPLYEQ